jgi:hypothetical protein
MSLLSAVVAVSAHLGALGFTAGASNPAPAVATAAAPASPDPSGSLAVTAATAATASPASSKWHHDDRHEQAATTVNASTVRTGDHDD